MDSNGLKKIYRNWNEVSGEKFEAKEPVAGNYYAITSYIGFESHNKTFGIFVDRPQGGTATQNHKTATHHGSDIEIMLLRKCLKDDNRGVSSPLLEVAEDGTNLNILTLHKLWLQNDSQDVAEIQRPYESPLQLFFGKSKDHPIKKNLSNLLNQNLLTHTHLKDPNTLIIRIKCTNETQVFDESFFENILNNRKMTGKITQLNLAENADYRRSQSEWGDDDFVFDNFEKIEKNWEELEDFRFTCKGYPIKSFEIKFIR